MGHMQGISDLAICHKLRVRGYPQPPKVAHVVRWTPPPPGCYKINTDGSTNNGFIYAGCIVRNSLGYFVAAFSMMLGRGVALDAEILAAMHNVIFAHKKGWTNVWVETDSTIALKILKGSGRLIPWKIKYCWNEYEEVRNQISLQVSHIHREGNSIADLISKLHYDHVWVGGCSDFISSMLFSDMNSDYFRIT